MVSTRDLEEEEEKGRGKYYVFSENRDHLMREV
jgi:hypothetical protein